MVKSSLSPSPWEDSPALKFNIEQLHVNKNSLLDFYITIGTAAAWEVDRLGDPVEVSTELSQCKYPK